MGLEDFDVTWMDVDCGPSNTPAGRGEVEEYLTAVEWTPSGDCLIVQVQSRSQREVRVLRFDSRTGERLGPSPLLVEQREDTWVNLNNMMYVLKDQNNSGCAEGGHFIWASEKTGFCHLYLHCSVTGRCLNAITAGTDWCVDELKGVDEGRGWVYFTGSKGGPLERHLYRSRLFGGPCDPEQLTTEPGQHSAALDNGMRRFIDIYDSLEMPPTVVLRALPEGDGHLENPLRRINVFYSDYFATELLKLEPPKLVEIVAADGSTKLHGALYRPNPKDHGPGPYRTLIKVYGGPGVQMVQNSWDLTADTEAQNFRNQGYLVFMLDNRGSARRGTAFEGTIRHRLGMVEIMDQIAGVTWLVSRGLADPERVGIFGWSYGGVTESPFSPLSNSNST